MAIGGASFGDAAAGGDIIAGLEVIAGPDVVGALNAMAGSGGMAGPDVMVGLVGVDAGSATALPDVADESTLLNDRSLGPRCIGSGCGRIGSGLGGGIVEGGDLATSGAGSLAIGDDSDLGPVWIAT